MPRQELVTADILNQIESWVDAGLNPKAIAEKIGCTLGTLKVRCAQLGISLRRKTHVAMRGRGAVGDTYAVSNGSKAIERTHSADRALGTSAE